MHVGMLQKRMRQTSVPSACNYKLNAMERGKFNFCVAGKSDFEKFFILILKEDLCFQ